ncbi:MAG: rhodanese-like domain-containing protein [Defluviitaleaceae bacterium]|nr:rhodanese-like domain-containing protein [Defluviitaleaceae bacterium]
MKILIIGNSLAETSATYMGRNIEGAVVTFANTRQEVLHSVDGNIADMKETDTGRIYQQEFDILVNTTPPQTDGVQDDILHLQDGGCPKYQWQQTLEHLANKRYTTATVAGDCASAAQMAVNLYVHGIMPTIITGIANFPKGFDPDVATHLRQQLWRWGININHMTHPYLPEEEGRITLAFSDQHPPEPSQQILAPNLSEKFGSERATAVINVVKRSLVPPRREGALAVTTRFFQAGMTGVGEAKLMQSAINYIYSVSAFQGGFIKLIYGTGGKIYGFSAIGGGADGFVDLMATLVACGGTVETLANLDFISPFAELVALGKIASEVISGQTRIAYWDEATNVNPETTILLDVGEYADFARYSLPGSINIPLNDLKFSTHLLSTVKDIIVISGRGMDATKAAKILTNKGYKARVLTGGLEYYKMVSGGVR